MNLVVFVGRLTSDPEIRRNGDKTVGKFSLAVNRKFKRDGEADADFFNCVVFGKTAEFLEKYFHKGMKTVVTGELRNNYYTDNNGVKHYSEQVIVNTLEFAESKNSTPAQSTDNDGFMNIPNGIDEELPFN